MNYEVQVSNYASKAIKKGLISREQLAVLLDKFIFWLEGININIDAVKMTGKWKGSYRIRFRDIRIVLCPNFEEQKIFIDRIDTRGGAYKK